MFAKTAVIIKPIHIKIIRSKSNTYVNVASFGLSAHNDSHLTLLVDIQVLTISLQCDFIGFILMFCPCCLHLVNTGPCIFL